MTKKTKKSIDDRINDLKIQQKDVSRLFDKLQGAIEILEAMKEEDDEKTN